MVRGTKAEDAIKDREDNILKSFRAQVRGVTDLPFFMYRVGKIYG